MLKTLIYSEIVQFFNLIINEIIKNLFQNIFIYVWIIFRLFSYKYKRYDN